MRELPSKYFSSRSLKTFKNCDIDLSNDAFRIHVDFNLKEVNNLHKIKRFRKINLLLNF